MIFYRRHKKRFLAPLDEELFSVFSPSELEITERKMSIAFAIAALPAKYWAVLLLRYDNGFSEEEAAQIMSMSLENVHKTIQRAKKRLKQILEEREE